MVLLAVIERLFFFRLAANSMALIIYKLPVTVGILNIGFTLFVEFGLFIELWGSMNLTLVLVYVTFKHRLDVNLMGLFLFVDTSSVV